MREKTKQRSSGVHRGVPERTCSSGPSSLNSRWIISKRPCAMYVPCRTSRCGLQCSWPSSMRAAGHSDPGTSPLSRALSRWRIFRCHPAVFQAAWGDRLSPSRSESESPSESRLLPMDISTSMPIAIPIPGFRYVGSVLAAVTRAASAAPYFRIRQEPLWQIQRTS